MLAQDYTQDEIFKKKLLFLIPFYAIRYEKKLRQAGMDPADKEQMLADFSHLQERLQAELPPKKQAKIYIDLIKLMHRVADYVLRNDESAKKGVDAIMSGHALKLYSEILEERSEKRGEKRGEVSAFKKMVQLGKITIAEAAEALGVSPEAFKKMAML